MDGAYSALCLTSPAQLFAAALYFPSLTISAAPTHIVHIFSPYPFFHVLFFVRCPGHTRVQFLARPIANALLYPSRSRVLLGLS